MWDFSDLDAALAAASYHPHLYEQAEAIRNLTRYPPTLIMNHLVRSLGHSYPEIVDAAIGALEEIHQAPLCAAVLDALSCWDIDGFRTAIATSPPWTLSPLSFDTMKWKPYREFDEYDAQHTLIELLRESGEYGQKAAAIGFLNFFPQRKVWQTLGKKDNSLAEQLQPFLDKPNIAALLTLPERSRARSLPAFVHASLTSGEEDFAYCRKLIALTINSLPTKEPLTRAMQVEMDILADRFWESYENYVPRFLQIAADHKLSAFRSLGLTKLCRSGAIGAAAADFLAAIGQRELVEYMNYIVNGKFPWILFSTSTGSSKREDLELALMANLADETDVNKAHYCMEALAHLLGERVIPKLLVHVKTQGKLSKQAADVIAHFGAPSVEPLLRTARSLREPPDSLIETIAHLGPAKPVIIEMLTREPANSVAVRVAHKWGAPWPQVLAIRTALESSNSQIRLDMIASSMTLELEYRAVLLPRLIQLLKDKLHKVRLAAIRAIEESNAIDAIPALLSALGERNSSQDESNVLSNTITRMTMGDRTILCSLLREGTSDEKLGVLRWMQCSSETEPFLSFVRELIHDINPAVALLAVSLLNEERDAASCVHLLTRLGGDNAELSQSASITLLNVLPLPSHIEKVIARRKSFFARELVDHLSLCASRWIEVGKTMELDATEDPAAAILLSFRDAFCRAEDARPLLSLLDTFLSGTACQERPELARVSLILAMLCADTFAERQDFLSAIALQRQIAQLAHVLRLPAVQWRAWQKIGNNLERAGDDREAWKAFLKASSIIDEMWFALLDEHLGRTFFKDKAILYDQAVHCCLRLRYDALALEMAEKAKTRYLGDLIARKQFEPRRDLAPKAHSFWTAVKESREGCANSASDKIKGAKPILTRVSLGNVPQAGNAWQPKHRASLIRNSDNNSHTRYRTRIIDYIWTLVARYQEAHEDLRDEIGKALKEVYGTFRELRKSFRGNEFALDQEAWIENYRTAAFQLLNIPGEEQLPLWVFSEYSGAIADIVRLRGVDPPWAIQFVHAIMEALDVCLRNEPVEAVRAEPEDQHGDLRFYASLNPSSIGSPGIAKGSSSFLESHSRDWDYLERLARGEATSYATVQKALTDETCLVQFHVTDSGTFAFLIKSPSGGPETFTFPDMTCQVLTEILVGDRGWVPTLHMWREGKCSAREWSQEAERILEQSYERLFRPIDERLRELAIRRLLIIPHRGLQILPFHAFFRTEQGERRYVLDDYEITYAPSSTLAMISRERRGHSHRPHALLGILGDIHNLETAEYELDMVAQHFGGSSKIIDGGSIDQLAHALRSHIHFVGHAAYNYEAPLESCLFLAQNSRLSLASLLEGQFALPRVDLCCLSGCETAVTDPLDASDEYIGLTGGFLFAGAGAVVSTLWEVPDISTGILMEYFYKELLNPDRVISAACALQTAQRWLRDLTIKDLYKVIKERGDRFPKLVSNQIRKKHPLATNGDMKPFSTPAFWGAFIASGGPTTI